MNKNLHLKKFAFKSNPLLESSNIEDLDLKYNDLSKKSNELYKLWMEDQNNKTLKKYKEVENLKKNIKSQINEYYNLKNRVNKEILKKKKEKIKVENEKTLTNEKINRGFRNSLLIGGTLGGVILYTLLTKKNLNENL